MKRGERKAVVSSNNYGWAFGLPEKFGSGISGSLKFGFSEMLPEICYEKSIPDISGTRKFGFGFTRYARNPPICKPPPAGAPLLSPEVDAQQPPARAAPRCSGPAAT